MPPPNPPITQAVTPTLVIQNVVPFIFVYSEDMNINEVSPNDGHKYFHPSTL